MTLEEIRAKYPQYNHLPDQEIADRLYGKYYSEKMPVEEFYSKIGFIPDASTQSQNANPEEKSWTDRTLEGAEDALWGLKTGVERTTQGLMQPIYNSGIFGEEAKERLNNMAQRREEIYKHASDRSPWAALAGNITGGIGSTLPTLPAGGAASSSLLKAYPWLGKFGAGLGAAAVEGGLFGGSQWVNPGETRLDNAIHGAEAGVAGSAFLQGLGKVGNAVASKVFPASKVAEHVSPNLSAADLAKSLRAAEGTSTPIGDILQSPYLKKTFENKIIPGVGSGGQEILGKIEGQIANKTENVLDKLGNQYQGQDLNNVVKEMMDSAFTRQQKIKNGLYDSVSEIAKHEKFAPDLPEFTNLAKETISTIENSPLLSTDPKTRQLFNKVAGFQNPTKDVMSPIVDQYGKPLVSKTLKPSIKEVNILANKLWDEGSKLSYSPVAQDRHMAGLFKDLATKARHDIRDEITSKGSKELQSAYGVATENYKKNFSGFLDKDIYKFLGDKKDGESIVREIIRPSKAHDKANRIKKVQDILPNDEKNLLGYSFLQSARNKEGDLTAQSVNKQLNSLGNRQFNALFPDKTLQREIKDLQRLYKLNPEALQRMHNPKTGARLSENVDAISTLGQAALGGSLGGWGGAAVTLGIKPLLNNHLAKKFTSEDFRGKVINEIVKNAMRKDAKPMMRQYLEKLLTTSLASKGVQE